MVPPDAGRPLHEAQINALSADLADHLAEAVAFLPDPHARSAVICSVVREIYDTMVWIHGATAESAELQSLRLFVNEAEQHQLRMSALLRDGH